MMRIYKQETSKSCGVACLRSAFNHYGNDYSEKDIWAKHNSFKELNPIISLGLTALKFGFEVVYMGYNPVIVNNNKYPKDLKKSLKIKSKKYFNYGKFIVDTSLEFLDRKGRIIENKLSLNKIKSLIEKEKFIIINVKPAFITGRGLVDMNHKVIVYGYNNNGFNILNPSDATEEIWDFDSFLLAFYAAVPELLIIRKKKKI